MAREPKSTLDDVVDNSGVMPEQTATTVEAPAKPFDQNAHSMEISRIIREARANENSSALRGEVNRLKSQIRRMQSEGVR